MGWRVLRRSDSGARVCGTVQSSTALKRNQAQAWWCRPVIPTTWDTEARGSQVAGLSELWSEFRASVGNLVRTSFKKSNSSEAGRWAGMCETLGSNPRNTIKEKDKERKKKKKKIRQSALLLLT